VQQVIKAAKAGDWREDDGVVVAGGIALEAGEYELTLSTGDGGESRDALGLLPGGGFVLLRTETTPELEAEGIARDAIRAVQEARKNAGLAVSDRIVLALNASAELAPSLEAHAALIAGETLAVGFAVTPLPADELAAVLAALPRIGAGVHVTRADALGTDKAPLVITIDATQDWDGAEASSAAPSTAPATTTSAATDGAVS